MAWRSDRHVKVKYNTPKFRTPYGFVKAKDIRGVISEDSDSPSTNDKHDIQFGALSDGSGMNIAYPMGMADCVYIDNNYTLLEDLQQSGKFNIVWCSRDHNTVPINKSGTTISRNRVIENITGNVLCRLDPTKNCYIDKEFQEAIDIHLISDKKLKLNMDFIDILIDEKDHIFQYWRDGNVDEVREYKLAEDGFPILLNTVKMTPASSISTPNLGIWNQFVPYYEWGGKIIPHVLRPNGERLGIPSYAISNYKDPKKSVVVFGLDNSVVGRLRYYLGLDILCIDCDTGYNAERTGIFYRTVNLMKASINANNSYPTITNYSLANPELKHLLYPLHVCEILNRTYPGAPRGNLLGETYNGNYGFIDDILSDDFAGEIIKKEFYYPTPIKLRMNIENAITMVPAGRTDAIGYKPLDFEGFLTSGELDGFYFAKPNHHSPAVYTGNFETNMKYVADQNHQGIKYKYCGHFKKDTDDTVFYVTLYSYAQDGKYFIISGSAIRWNKSNKSITYDPRVYQMNKTENQTIIERDIVPLHNFKMEVPFLPDSVEILDDGVLIRQRLMDINNVNTVFISNKQLSANRVVRAYDQRPVDHSLSSNPYDIIEYSTSFEPSTKKHFISIPNPLIRMDTKVNVSINPESNMDYDKIIAAGMQPVVQELDGCVRIYFERSGKFRNFTADLEICY